MTKLVLLGLTLLLIFKYETLRLRASFIRCLSLHLSWKKTNSITSNKIYWFHYLKTTTKWME